MATKRSDTAQDVYQLKVTLLGTKPPIWRRLVVPASITLAKLHDVLQSAMGWHDCHMHQFCMGDRLFGKPDPEDFAMGMPPVENERAIKLSSVLRSPGAKMIYTYDFGDNWEHAVVLEKRLPLLDMSYPICIAGKLACPPDDCGGIPGFYNLLDALADPNHEQHEEMRDWIGEEFDPLAFSVDTVNLKLAPKRHRSTAARS